ncbi:MAG: hypothetical protein RR295_07780, partial [Oscillospiraceae bacterium]
MLPFERNRYYVGKLLTSADFQAEQIYGGQKRRFLNRLVLGGGILSGLSVYSLDDVSIMLESGAAVDGWGREVVVENTVMKKLSAIDGFLTLATNHAVLCLRYEEEPVYPVFSISAGGGEENYEYNRVREGYTLCLRDRDTLPQEPTQPAGFLSSETLYEDEDYAVTLTMPAVMGCGQPVRFEVQVAQLSDTRQPLSLQAPLQIPALQTAEGEHVCNIELEQVLPGKGNRFTRAYFLTAGAVETRDSALMLTGMRVTVGESTKATEERRLFKISVRDCENAALIAKTIGSVSLENLDLEGQSELIPLAEFTLQRTKNAYLIEAVAETGVQRYIETNAAAPLRSSCQKWLPAVAPAVLPRRGGENRPELTPPPAKRELLFATGVCEIPIPVFTGDKQVVYSDEIVHGLGSGTVQVDVGLEYFAQDKKLNATARNTIFGDPALFPDADVPSATFAVRVQNDRGSFVVAAKLEAPTTRVSLTVRWNAIVLPIGDENVKLHKIEGKSIAAVRPTVVMATRESYYFSVNFKNMEPCTLTYA